MRGNAGLGEVERYRTQLRALQDWRPFLLAESDLPGPRANLELVQAAADVGDRARFLSLLLPPERTPAGTPLEFLTVCGIVGLGACAARGETGFLPLLREWAADPRWRVREAVAMALQRVRDCDLALLLQEMTVWIESGFYEHAKRINSEPSKTAPRGAPFVYPD